MDGSLPWSDTQQRSTPVGTKARQAFRRILFQRQGYEFHEGILHHWFLRPLMRLFVIAWFTGRYARRVKRHYGIPIRTQLAQQLHLVLRNGINPKIYYFLELYRMWSDDIGEQCLMRYECKNGLLKALHKLRPKVYGRRVSLGHKLTYADHCDRYGLPSPDILVVGDSGGLIWRAPNRAALHRDLFLKPEISRGARGALWLRYLGDERYLAGDGREMSLDGFLDLVAEHSKTQAQMVQVALRNHESLADLAEDSLIVFRIFTCMDRFGQPVATHAMLRTIAKLEPNWHREDEYAVPVNLVTGELGLMCGDKQFGPDDWFETHPVTGAQVKGRIVQHWDAIRDLAVAGHRIFADRMMLGWDVALTPDGPVLVEANAYPDTEFLQRVHRQPIGYTRLGEILSEQIDLLPAMLPGSLGANGEGRAAAVAPVASIQPHEAP
jgi:hypothetical protein